MNFDDDTEVQTKYVSTLNDPPRRFRNPYRMNRNDVKITDFYDARIYDPQAEEGFTVPRYYAKKMYYAWLNNVRKNPGWEGFRRPPILVTEEVEKEDGSTYVIRKWISWSELNHTNEKIMKFDAAKNKNVPHKLEPQSRIRGAKLGDEHFKAKMFTGVMGKNIAQLRNSLNMTQADLAKKINVDTPMIRDIELGDKITFNSEDIMVKNLAKALGIKSISYQE